MSFGIRVEGGSGAGCKRPLRLRPNWTCSCAVEHNGATYSCSECGERRP